MESTISLDVLANGLQGFGHPLRIRVLVLLERERSPRELAELLGAPLGLTAYHVRMAVTYGLAELTRTEPRRGALAHWYKRTALADRLLGELSGVLELPARRRGAQGERRALELEAWAQHHGNGAAAEPAGALTE